MAREWSHNRSSAVDYTGEKQAASFPEAITREEAKAFHSALTLFLSGETISVHRSALRKDLFNGHQALLNMRKDLFNGHQAVLNIRDSGGFWLCRSREASYDVGNC
ncbi:MAG: hypothetical protein QXZ09_06645 [Candidatus Methanomethylicaceae archaeon]